MKAESRKKCGAALFSRRGSRRARIDCKGSRRCCKPDGHRLSTIRPKGSILDYG